MKLLAPLVAAAVLAGSLAVPAFAHTTGAAHVHVMPAPVLTPLFPKRPVWSYQIDRSILRPIPRPFPWPGPNPCLSCPPFDMNPGEIVQPVLR